MPKIIQFRKACIDNNGTYPREVCPLIDFYHAFGGITYYKCKGVENSNTHNFHCDLFKEVHGSGKHLQVIDVQIVPEI